jgi:hypothetical protein
MTDPLPAAPADPPAGAVERRASARHPCRAGAFARPAARPDAAGWWANLLDLSAGGLRLFVSQRLEPGELLEVDLYCQRRTVRVAMRVIHSSPRPGGCWLVGAEFTTGPLAEAELQALL